MAVRFTGKKQTLDLESLKLSIPEGERRLLPACGCLFSVEYVEVVHPQRQDRSCSIYGEISFSNHDSGPFYTPFKRSQNDPETIDLGNPKFRFLTLSDDGHQAPPLLVTGYPIIVRLELFEKKQPQPESGEDQSVDFVEDQSSITPIPETEKLEGGDTCIAKVESRFDDWFDVNTRVIYRLYGNSGFVFKVAHAFLVGCVPVGVRFTINDIPSEGLSSTSDGHEQGNLTGKRNRSIGIYGIIAAIQQVTIPPSPPPAIRLFYRSNDEEEEVCVGSPIRLDRTFLISPVNDGFLYIGYTLYCAENGELITTGIIPFPMTTLGTFFFVDKNLTHTRTSEDNRVSITLKFMGPTEATDPSGPPTGIKPIPDYDKLY